MNEVFLLGTIIKIKYNIVDRGKIYAIAFIDLETENEKDIIKLICKNSKADYVYVNMEEGNKIFVKGSLMKAHKMSKKGKRLRKEIILFSLNEEDNIKKLYEDLKYGRYKHENYTSFKVYETKERIIEKASYRDRIVHRWITDNFLVPYYIPSFIKTTYACIKDRRDA